MLLTSRSVKCHSLKKNSITLDKLHLRWVLETEKHTVPKPPTPDPSHMHLMLEKSLFSSTDGSYTTDPGNQLSKDFCQELEMLALMLTGQLQHSAIQ